MVSGAGGDRKSRPVLFWAFTALLVVGLNLYAPGDPTDMERLLASTIIVVAAASIWFWMGRRNLEIAFIPLFSIMFAINYALGIFLLTSNAIEGKNDMRLLPPTFNLVLILSLAGDFLLILLAYYGPWWRYLIPRMPKCQLCSEYASGSSAR